MEDDRAEEPGSDDVERRMRTRIRPLSSVSDSVQSGFRPSKEITSSSISNFVMAAAVGPGNCVWMSSVAALYSKRKSKSVYLPEIE